jgi:hypothetical protein
MKKLAGEFVIKLLKPNRVVHCVAVFDDRGSARRTQARALLLPYSGWFRLDLKRRNGDKSRASTARARSSADWHPDPIMRDIVQPRAGLEQPFPQTFEL